MRNLVVWLKFVASLYAGYALMFFLLSLGTSVGEALSVAVTIPVSLLLVPILPAAALAMWLLNRGWSYGGLVVATLAAIALFQGLRMYVSYEDSREVLPTLAFEMLALHPFAVVLAFLIAAFAFRLRAQAGGRAAE